MPSGDLIPCRCGEPPPEVESDPICRATLLECLACGRVVGGLDATEAAAMWNSAMQSRESST